MKKRILLCLVCAACCNFGCRGAPKRTEPKGTGSTGRANASSVETAAELVVDRISAFDETGRLVESVGVETLGGVFTPLLRTGCMEPCVITEHFSTAADNQKSIQVHLYRGSGARVADNRDLGVFVIEGIRAAPRGNPKIEIVISASREGLLLKARDLSGPIVRVSKREGG